MPVFEGIVLNQLAAKVDNIVAGAPWVADWFRPGMVCVSRGGRAFEVKDPNALPEPDALGCGGWDSTGRLEWIGLDLDVGHGAEKDAYETTEQAVEAAGAVVDFVGGAGEIRRSKSGVGIHIRVRIEPLELGDTVRKVAGYIAKWIASTCEIKRDPTVLGRQNLWFWAREAKEQGFKLERAAVEGARWKVPPAALREPVKAAPAPLPSVPRAKTGGAGTGADAALLQKRVKGFVDKFKIAVQGQHGQTEAFKLASCLVNGFELPKAEAWDWMLHWNQRCQPPWGADEMDDLRHQFDRAAADGQGPGGAARGWLLNDPGDFKPGSGKVWGGPSEEELRRMDASAEALRVEMEAASGNRHQEHDVCGNSSGEKNFASDVQVGAASSNRVENTTARNPGTCESSSLTAGPKIVLASNSHGARGNQESQNNSHWPGQPLPLGPPPGENEKRPELANFHWEDRWVVTEVGAEAMPADVAKFKALAKRESRAKRLRARDEKINTDETRKAEHQQRAVDARVIVNAPTGSYSDLNAEEIKWFEDKRLEACGDEHFVELKTVAVMKGAAELRAQIFTTLHGWPMLLSGAWLFVDDGRWRYVLPDEEPFRRIEDSTEFKSFLHGYFHLQFNRGQDVDRANYVDFETLYAEMYSHARNWQAVERYPHCPPLPGHYYVWEPPADYAPDGSHVAELLMFFDNVPDFTSRAILAAAILTPFSGIPYGRRPAIITEAAKRGAGKSTIPTAIANLVGGAINIEMDQHAQDKIMERILSPEGMDKRIILADNVTVTLRSPKLDQLVTNTVLSGKRLGIGEGRRPNNLCMFVTMNNAKVSPDMARRSFFIGCVAPEKTVKDRVQWDAALTAFLLANSARVAADALAILGAAEVEVDWGALTQETFAPWAREVLARAMAHAGVMQAIRAGSDVGDQEEGDVKGVLAATQARRDERNEEIGQAQEFMAGLYECVAAWKKYKNDLTLNKFPPADKEIFIRTAPPPESTDSEGKPLREQDNFNMVSFWKKIFQKGQISSKWVTETIEEHIDGGRIWGLRRKKQKDASTGKDARGFLLDPAEPGGLIDWLKARYAEEEKLEHEKDASNVSEVSAATA